MNEGQTKQKKQGKNPQKKQKRRRQKKAKTSLFVGGAAAFAAFAGLKKQKRRHPKKNQNFTKKRKGETESKSSCQRTN